MSAYLDASVLVALWVNDDALSTRASALLRGANTTVIVSDFASAEFASAIARHVRIGSFDRKQAQAALFDFDRWKERAAMTATIESGDVTAAAAVIRRLELNFRAPDAIHIAIAGRLGADLATFDEGLANCARLLQQPVFAG